MVTTEVRDPQQVEEKSLAISHWAKTLIVSDAATYTMAGDIWKRLNEMEKEAHEALDPVVESANKAHKEAVALRKRIIDPITEAKTHVKKSMSDYDAEQARKAEQERLRLEAEAKKAEEERLLAEAVTAEQSGNHEEAEVIMAEPIVTPTIIVQKEVPKVVGGPTYQTRWDFTIEDINKIPREYLVPDLVAIRRVVTALKDRTNIPGIKVFSKRV